MLDVPDEVRRRVLADGNGGWLDEVPRLADSIARDWSLTLGASLRGGVSSLVVEASLNDGTAAVLKIGVPGSGRELGYEATVLRLAGGDACARLLRADLERSGWQPGLG
jgi:streptomycin 6-kinase